MANKKHGALTESDGIHEPKGVNNAPLGSVYMSNGLGSGSWLLPDTENPAYLDLLGTRPMQGPVNMAGFNITNVPNLQPIDPTLTSLAGLNATVGFIVQTAVDTFIKRLLTGTTNRISITNGTGVTDNPSINIDPAFDTTILNQANAYADSIITRLWKDQGSYDASVNTFPIAANTNPVVANILTGFIWTISVAGILGGVPVNQGDTVRAIINNPGQTASNWTIAESNIGYVPENQTNKATDFSTLDNVKYPTTQATNNLVEAAKILSRIGSSTYSSIQHLMNFALSPGVSSGGSITDAGGGTVNVAAGTGFIKAVDSNVATLSFFDWSASNGIVIPTNSTRYIGVQYNAGTPNIVVKTSDTWDMDTEFPLGIAVNEAGNIFIINIPWVTADNIVNLIERFDGLHAIQRDGRIGGLIINYTGTRNITISATNLMARMSEFTFNAIDTSVSSTIDGYYRNGSGGWIRQIGLTQFNVTDIDTNTGSLVAMTTSYYSSRWFYAMTDGTSAKIYGQAEYSSIADALNDPPPSTLPDRIQKLGILIGRFIIQKSNNIPVEVQSAFDTSFNATDVQSAQDLSNGVTGTGKIVLENSPVLIAPNLGVALATSLNGILPADILQSESDLIISAPGDITTTSTVDVLATTMTRTPGAGVYIAIFATQVFNSNTNNSNFISIYANNVLVPDSTRNTSGLSATATAPIFTIAGPITVTAGQTIEGRWRVSANTGTMGNRILILLKIG